MSAVVRRPSSRLVGALGAVALALALAACGSSGPDTAEEAVAEAAARDDVPEAVEDFAESMGETEVPSDFPTPETYEEYKANQESQAATEDEAGQSEPGSGNSPGVGECLDHFPTSAEVDAGAIEIVDCAGEHAADVYAVVEMERLGAEYPVFDELYAALLDDCGNAYLDHWGGPVTDTGIQFNFVTPSRADWEDGETDVFCYAYPDDLEDYSGELQAADR